MRICDRCHSKDGSARPAVHMFKRQGTDEETDLCQSCADETSDFLNNVTKKHIPKKDTKPSGRRNRKTAKTAKK